MSTYLGGTQLPDPIIDPGSEDVETRSQGEIIEMSDGSIVYHSTGSYRMAWTLTWRLLSSTDFNTLKTKATVTTTQIFYPPDGSGPFTVVVTPNGFVWRAYEIGGGVPVYDAELKLEQTAVN